MGIHVRVGLVLLALVAFIAPFEAAAYENDSVSIGSSSGLIKGFVTGVSYDSYGQFLYDASGVLADNVMFSDLLFDCTDDGTAGRVCANPVTGTYGYHERTTGYYVCDELHVSALDAWFEPSTGKWLDDQYSEVRLDPVDSPERPAMTYSTVPWRVYTGSAAELEQVLLTALLSSKQPSLGRPTLGIEVLQPSTPLAWVADDHALNPTKNPIPHEVPVAAIANRLSRFCGVEANNPFDGRSGYERLAEFKDRLSTLLQRRWTVANRVNSKLAEIAKDSGRAFNRPAYPAAAIEAQFFSMFDSMESWYILYQGSPDDLRGIALAAFRQTDSGTVLDWWPVELYQVRRGGSYGARGVRVKALTQAMSGSPALLMNLVYSVDCGGLK